MGHCAFVHIQQNATSLTNRHVQRLYTRLFKYLTWNLAHQGLKPCECMEFFILDICQSSHFAVLLVNKFINTVVFNSGFLSRLAHGVQQRGVELLDRQGALQKYALPEGAFKFRTCPGDGGARKPGDFLSHYFFPSILQYTERCSITSSICACRKRLKLRFMTILDNRGGLPSMLRKKRFLAQKYSREVKKCVQECETESIYKYIYMKGVSLNSVNTYYIT